jgi:hypothetical protein
MHHGGSLATGGDEGRRTGGRSDLHAVEAQLVRYLRSGRQRMGLTQGAKEGILRPRSHAEAARRLCDLRRRAASWMVD